MDSDWFRRVLKERGLRRDDAAAAAGMTENMLTKSLNGHRTLSAEEADRLRAYLGFVPPDALPKVDVNLELQDGGKIVSASVNVKIHSPAWVLPDGVSAARVVGSAAEPLALSGDIIFWNAKNDGVAEADLGRVVVAEIQDGTVILKRLATSAKSGMWSLVSLNPLQPNIMDVEIKWAARVLPVLAADEVVMVDGSSDVARHRREGPR